MVPVTLRKLAAVSSPLYLAGFYLQNRLVAAVDDEDDDLGVDSEVDESVKKVAEEKKADLLPNGKTRPTHWQDSPVLTEMWKLTGRNGEGLSSDPEMEKKNEFALESYVYNNAGAVNHRAKDGRGFLWWAWEFQSAHALAVAKAYGADPFIGDTSRPKTDDVADFQDQEGAYPFHMCKGKKPPSDDIDDDLDEEALSKKDMSDIKTIGEMPEECHKLVGGKELKGLDALVKDILEKKQKREEAETAALDEEDEDDDEKSALGSKPGGAEETDDDDDDEPQTAKKKKKLDVNVGLDDDDL